MACNRESTIYDKLIVEKLEAEQSLVGGVKSVLSYGVWDLTPKQVSHWKMDDNAATPVVVDEMGNYNGEIKHYGGTLYNTDTRDIVGKVDGGFNVNRYWGAWAENAGSGLGDACSKFAISGGFNLNSGLAPSFNGGLFRIADIEGSSYDGFYLAWKKTHLELRGYGADLDIAYSDTDTWTLFVVSVDYPNVTVRIDNVEYTDTLTSIPDFDGQDVSIRGYDIYGTPGLTDEYRLFNASLTSDEMDRLWNDGDWTDANSGVVAGAEIDVNAVGTTEQIQSGVFTESNLDDQLFEGDVEIQGDAFIAQDVIVDGEAVISGDATVGGTSESQAGVIRNTSRYTANQTLDDDDHIVFCNGTFTITLPAGVEGAHYKIINSGTGTITVDGDGTEEVYGATTQDLTSGEILDIHFNSTDGWW